MMRAPMRFTIRSLQIAVVGVCWRHETPYADPRLYWPRDCQRLRSPCDVFAGACHRGIVVAARGSARHFAMGFLLGFVLEHVSMAYCVSHSLVRFSPTTLAPLGWYPFEIPFERMILIRGWADLNSASVPATFSGLLVSGILCGGLAFAIGEKVCGPRRSRGDAADRDDEHSGRVASSSRPTG